MNKLTQSEMSIPFYATHADTELPLLRLRYSQTRDEESISLPKVYCSFQIDANGSDDSKFIGLLNIGSSSTVYDQYQFSGYATGITDPDGNDGTPTHTQCTTFQAMLTAMNALDGIYAERLNCTSDFDIDTDDFIDTAKVQVGGNPFTNGFIGMYREASSYKTMEWRIGIPDCTKFGAVALAGMEWSYTGGGSDAMTIKISTDPGSTTSEENVAMIIAVTDGTLGSKDWSEDPIILNGPLLFEMASAGSITANDYCVVRYRNVQQ